MSPIWNKVTGLKQAQTNTETLSKRLKQQWPGWILNQMKQLAVHAANETDRCEATKFEELLSAEQNRKNHFCGKLLNGSMGISECCGQSSPFCGTPGSPTEGF